MSDKITSDNTNNIEPQVIEDEMKTSYLSYALSVIIGRAIPDARDGLKPVHRRILYAMNDLRLYHNKPFKKCARIVGQVLGTYHPHGDSAIYDSLVRMAQDFSMRKPLIIGQGNFGSRDGDSAAAYRYTEAKLNKISEELLEDIDKETVDFVDNFDGLLKEPTVLPSKIPNLLINGSSGIAVGMATNIPPHNLNEVCSAVNALIDNPALEISDLIEFIQAPDFPTGGIICGRHGIREAYKTGHGKVKVRSVTNFEMIKKRNAIIVTELPYMVNKAVLIQNIAALVRDGKLEGISDLRDESDRKGMRIVIELKNNALPEIVLNNLFKHTRLEETSGITMLAIVNRQPKLLTLKDALTEFIKHRFTVVTKRTKFDLKKTEARKHILEGLLLAIKNSDEVIKRIKQSASAIDAKKILKKKFSFSEIQAKAVLDMKLQKLAALEVKSIQDEDKQLSELIIKLKNILSDKNQINKIIKTELNYIMQNYGDERRSKITETIEDFEAEDLIDPEDVVVTISDQGYIKRTSLEDYRSQQRGGKGVIGSKNKKEDFMNKIFIANTHSYLLVITEAGKVHWLKIYQIPDANRTSKGKHIINLLDLKNSEELAAVLPIKEFKDDEFIMMSTKNGIVKKTSATAYAKPRKGGIIALGLKDNDQLLTAKLVHKNSEILLGTAQGKLVRFNEANVRPMGRTATGVIGAKLNKNDSVIGMVVANNDDKLLTITKNGYGKKTNVSEYRLTKRGGKGVLNIKTSERNGDAVSIKNVNDEDEIVIASKKGILIRMRSGGISTIGRNTLGVRLMKLSEDDEVISSTIIKNGEE